MSDLEPFLKTGVILANFNFSGKLPLAKESLTKNARGSDIQSLIINEILLRQCADKAQIKIVADKAQIKIVVQALSLKQQFKQPSDGKLKQANSCWKTWKS